MFAARQVKRNGWNKYYSHLVSLSRLENSLRQGKDVGDRMSWRGEKCHPYNTTQLYFYPYFVSYVDGIYKFNLWEKKITHLKNYAENALHEFSLRIFPQQILNQIEPNPPEAFVFLVFLLKRIIWVL